ncbi:MAG: UDP-3-O-(3-hydroxymyristoyl)glucosamine N-acyltransferase [Rickettsiales bacterium]|jgi:UDP-3-O-[3-hydroxymyristoyl] glucosamine N-acyltransferase|nr:UDP-3-O-(3-hydroxymyristoyl)glucosamine N-acyltransferase [Rickettsiales bacterium]
MGLQSVLQLAGDLVEAERFNDFFRRRHRHITLGEIDELARVENIGDLDREKRVYNLRALRSAEEGDITFFANPRYARDLGSTKASYCLVARDSIRLLSPSTRAVVVANVQSAFARILDYLYAVPRFLLKPSVATGAWVDPTASIGPGVEIEQNSHLGERVVVARGCKICANVVIGHDCQLGEGTYVGPNSTLAYARIGANCVIQNGVNIGQCGFGFAPEKDFNYKIPQVGLVLLGDNVEIGSGTCVDRGTLENTTIGSNTKIDNMVQIAHGVRIGVGCLLAAQVGIAGSSVIGDYVHIGGQVGIAGHLTIGDRVKIAACSGVAKDVEAGAMVAGSPAMAMGSWLRSTVILKKLAKGNSYAGD